MLNKKWLSRFGTILTMMLLILSFVLPTKVEANDIESIQITATIQDNGSVIIRDHRVFHAEEGTEHYISLGSMGDAELLNFTVYDENGEPLEDIGDWDINASFEEKAGKYGVYDTGSELELAFGLGEYGRREFTMEYELSNFITNLEDNHQAFYWQFINSDMDPIEKVDIQVRASNNFEFVNPETRLWAFGHEGGQSEITSEALTMTTGENFSQSDYIVLLGIFEGVPFNTAHQSDSTSDELIEQAMDGATLDGYDYQDFLDGNIDEGGFSVRSLMSVLMGFVRLLFPLLIFFGFASKNSRSKRKKSTFKTTVTDEYYREVPYEDHFIETTYLTNSEVSDWVSAFILKWVSEGRLIDQVEETGWIFKKDSLALRINNEYPEPTNRQEQELWNMILAAAGSDHILSESEFNKYVKRNISSFNRWTDSIPSKSKQVLEKKGYLTKQSEKVLGLFNQTYTSITPEGQQLGDNIVAFKNYLKDFSLVGEREVSHVQLWQELMIWAAYMGIAEEVYEQLKIANPQFEQQMTYNPSTIIMMNHFARSIQSTQTSANTSSTSSSFSGGGGGSFGGGGGGSFGGGSGGGTR